MPEYIAYIIIEPVPTKVGTPARRGKNKDKCSDIGMFAYFVLFCMFVCLLVCLFVCFCFVLFCVFLCLFVLFCFVLFCVCG